MSAANGAVGEGVNGNDVDDHRIAGPNGNSNDATASVLSGGEVNKNNETFNDHAVNDATVNGNGGETATGNNATVTDAEPTIPLGRYMWERIHQVGVNHIFGVPGDFNLTLLDHIYKVKGLNWVGNTNELNAAYAADGYARVSGRAGCFVTTHGVGELSALNGVAGSMTEQVKVIHVVGQTFMKMQREHMMIHHSIGFNPDHQVFNNASKGFRVAAAEVFSAEGAAQKIDDTLRECFVKSGPVYIFVPIDMVDVPVPAKLLKAPLNLEPEVDEKVVQRTVDKILDVLYSSKNPALYIDCLVQRRGANAEAQQLVEKLAIPVYTSNMGKGIIDETHQHYAGLYNGVVSGAGVQDAFGKHDFVLMIGNLPSDTNSGGFTRTFPQNTIYVNTDDVVIDCFKTVGKTPLKAVVKRLTASASPMRIPHVANPRHNYPPRPVEHDAENPEIRQSYLWHRLAQFMQPHDVVFGETGTAAFGLPDATFPPDLHWITQTYYGSIGFATPAAFGADLALIDGAAKSSRPRGRTLLVTGDGSMMLTMQEIGNMVKTGTSPIIFLINNAGYTIERVIHGAHETYNDIVPSVYAHMLPFFNMPATQAANAYHRASTRKELEAILALDRVQKPTTVQVVEIVTDKMDVPWRLGVQVAARGKQALEEMREAGFDVTRTEPIVKGIEGFWTK